MMIWINVVLTLFITVFTLEITTTTDDKRHNNYVNLLVLAIIGFVASNIIFYLGE